MLDLAKLFVLTLKLLLVDPVAFDFCHCTFVVKVVHCAVDLGAEVVVILEEFELTGGVSVKGSGRREWGSLERFDVLMRVPVDHAVYKGVFSILEFDILGRLHFATGETDVKRDVIRTFIQCVPFRDLWLWSISLPSSPQVNIWPFVSRSRRAINSWWWRSSSVAA